MSSNKARLHETIQSLISISDEERALLLSTLKAAEKEEKKMTFMVERLQKDKVIAQEILNATIEDLEKNKQKLQRSYDELEQFSYIVSHDLKGPLRTIGNFAKLLQLRYQPFLDESAKEFINFIVSGVKQMDNLIQHTLEYAKVGRDELEFERLDLNEVINIVIKNLQSDIHIHKAQIEAQQLPEIYGHKITVIQLFQNLIANAIKFKQKDHPPIVQINARPKGLFWEIAVKDNGIGIEQDYLNKIFKAFQRAGNKSRPGSGIGLAICKKIVILHHGDITLESKVGIGTTFFFTLRVTEFDLLEKGRNA